MARSNLIMRFEFLPVKTGLNRQVAKTSYCRQKCQPCWSHPVNHCLWFGTLFNNLTSVVTFSFKGTLSSDGMPSQLPQHRCSFRCCVHCGHAESKSMQHSWKGIWYYIIQRYWTAEATIVRRLPRHGRGAAKPSRDTLASGVRMFGCP